MINWGAENKLYLNDQNDQNFVQVAGLPIGARVALYDGDQLVASREVKSATGFCAQEPSTVHFGAEAGKGYTAKITAKGKTSSVAVKGGEFIKVN